MFHYDKVQKTALKDDSTSFDGGSGFIDNLRPDWTVFRPSLPVQIASLKPGEWKGELLAAATVAMVSIPQAVGFALIAGLPPSMVFACVIVGGLVASLFFSSKQLIFGPSNSLSMLLAATFALHAGSSLQPSEIAVVLALLIGLIQVGSGLLRLGQVTQFISRSVVIGYGAAIGCLLVLSQIPNLIGLRLPQGTMALAVPFVTAGNLLAGQGNLHSLALGVAAFLIFILIKRLRNAWPETLLGLLVFSILSWGLDLQSLGIRTLGAGGELGAGLPSFSGLPFGLEQLKTLRELFAPALALALLGILEAVSIAKTYGLRSGDRVDINRELVSMGLANLACAGSSAMPGSASFARSAANFQAGARTQLSGFASSLCVLALIVLLSPLLLHLPIPALAAALVRIGLNIVDLKQVRIAARSTRSDAAVLFGTFFAALVLPLDTAIFTGVGLSMALALRKASAPSLVEYGFDASGQLAAATSPKQRPHPQIAIIHVEGELFFGAADIFQEQIRARAEAENLKVVIVRLKNARHLDATTVFALNGLHAWMSQTGRHLVLSGVHGGVLRTLKSSGLLDLIGRENVFPAEENYALATKKALERARDLLGQGKAEVRLFYESAEMPTNRLLPVA